MGGGTPGRAQPLDEATLVWNAPPGCPDASAVLARVRARIAEHSLSDRSWRARAQVHKRAARYRLELTLYWPGGEARREVEAVSCDALADAAGVLISLALADAAAPEPEPISAPAPTSAAAPRAAGATAASSATPAARGPEERSAAQPASEPEAADQSGAGGLPAGRESTWHFRYGLAASLRLDLGMLPQQPAFGVGPRVLAQLGPLQALAGLTWWLVASSQPDSYPSARLEGSGVVGDLVFGFELLASPLRLVPCLVFEHGQLRVSSTNVTTPDQLQFAWTAAGGGVRASIALGVGLHAGLELLGLAPWSRQRLWLRTPGGDVALFATAPFALRISAELAYVFE